MGTRYAYVCLFLPILQVEFVNKVALHFFNLFMYVKANIFIIIFNSNGLLNVIKYHFKYFIHYYNYLFLILNINKILKKF